MKEKIAWIKGAIQTCPLFEFSHNKLACAMLLTMTPELGGGVRENQIL